MEWHALGWVAVALYAGAEALSIRALVKPGRLAPVPLLMAVGLALHFADLELVGVYVTNPDDGFLSAIDVTTNKVVARIGALGVIEQPRYDSADHMLYVVSPDRDSGTRLLNKGP